MKFMKKLVDSAKTVPFPVWVAGVLIPGGLTILAVYTTWKATQKSSERDKNESQGTDS